MNYSNRNKPVVIQIYGCFFPRDLTSVQTWNVRQAETDLFQAVTMPTFVLHGVDSTVD